MRRQDDGDSTPFLELRRVINTSSVVLVAHARRPAAVVYQRPGHAVIGGVLQVQRVIDVRYEQVIAAHHQIELQYIGRPNAHRSCHQDPELTFLVWISEATAKIEQATT